MWDKLYNKAHGGDDWKKVAVQTILLDLGYSPDAPNTDKGAKTSEALKKFQGDNGLSPTGKEDKATRTKLFLAYMDKHCRDEGGNPFKVEKKDFLAQGADKDGKGDYQGCSEFNPVLMFSKEEDKEYSKPENKEKRNAENAPNRRVLIFMFRPKSYTTPNLWPCPSVKEGIDLCKKRFWSDAKKRREFQENRREYRNTKDTFACRFYDRLGMNSPCENILLTFNTVDLIFQRYPGTEAASAIQGLEYEYTVAGSNPIRGTTGADGKVKVRIPPGETAELKIMDSTYLVSTLDNIDPFDEIKGVERRLQMLGYNVGNVDGLIGSKLEYAVLNFQADNAPLKVDGLPGASTQQAIRDKVGE
jgi:peptidoglycan hydrolase-like protein with peptidoglycan-binding domain